MKSLRFSKNFLMGTATASLQIEGGDRNNSWYRWAEQGHIQDGSHCIVACDHWNRVEQDIELMKTLRSRTYRLSLEWSRIEPQKGHFDQAAIDHYRNEIQLLLDAGIQPLVTLHHFSNPLWFEDMGGWLLSSSVAQFEKYTAYVVGKLGDLVAEWITINEPNVYLTMGFFEGSWPPGRRGKVGQYLKGARHMIAAHIKAYNTIHRISAQIGKKNTRVGVANHLRIFDPRENSLLDKFSCYLHDLLFQEIYVSGMSEGKLRFPLRGNPAIVEGRYLDFLGINYYSRDIITGNFNPLTLFGERGLPDGAEVNDLEWEIYPEGLYRICKQYYQRYQVPIYITENGICDAADTNRSRYIYDHLAQLEKAVSEGVDVQRYYHWTLMDNFEWVEGVSARFGLIAVDFDTQERTIRSSGKFYSEVCKNNSVTQVMIKKYLKPGKTSSI